MTKRVLTILSRIISVICHPLFMPSYGMLLFCATFSAQRGALPTAYWLIAVLGTLTLTAIIPLSVIVIQMFRGAVSSIEIRKAGERTSVYVYTIVCYGFWCYFLRNVLHAPEVLFVIGVGATVALLGVTLINLKWKISAHLTGIGGVIGGICGYCMYYALFPPVGLICGLLGLALLLMYARLYIDAHTPLQVVTGLIYGITIIFTICLFTIC